MRIACPYCGEREVGEFSYLGDASPKRPHYTIDDGTDPVVLEEAFNEYVYLRDNVAGTMREYWYHGGGCRSWLIAERSTLTHEFKSVQAAPGAGAAKVTLQGE
ncbi:N-methylglutamate dehydrogenase subunit B [Pseudaminobacter salicylatoxidans]|uniref:N-methylglutamate dehydrogenase subunit B n=1 Tax=Pseudaminobacter salicylatoxidans TaxID=93369 RepID=A0A316C1U5_PSESE|nr:sarcosine oxidase subunit delta [Pseudaminobacter salicylatoxidans]PWJ82436.1 N-methylglutamate dehydrogenase subunit B [Pseudaminobacter salicylatoxidans]